MNGAPKCHRCDAAMAEGFVADQSYGSYIDSNWHPGKPKTSWFSGARILKEELIPIITYRCKECGFLESYARKPESS